MSCINHLGSRIFVFVYGTLKSGQPNAAVMADPKSGAHKLIGTGRTVTAFPLIIATRYNIPYCLDKPGDGHQVGGEVYEVDQQKLEALDELEGHPNYYKRRLEKISMDDDKRIVDSWIYLLTKWNTEFLATATEYLQNYSSDGPHGRKYVERWIFYKNLNVPPLEFIK